MSGKIKAGKGTLIGNAGEYYVMAELLKRDVIAALAPRNAPSFDILATSDGKTARIRVKTKSQGQDPWQYMLKKDGSIFRDLQLQGDFTVFVELTMSTAELAFYVVPTSVVNDWLIADFDEWVRTPGKGGRPHDSTTRQRHLSFRKWKDSLAPYLEAWESLWQ